MTLWGTPTLVLLEAQPKGPAGPAASSLHNSAPWQATPSAVPHRR